MILKNPDTPRFQFFQINCDFFSWKDGTVGLVSNVCGNRRGWRRERHFRNCQKSMVLKITNVVDYYLGQKEEGFFLGKVRLVLLWIRTNKKGSILRFIWGAQMKNYLLSFVKILIFPRSFYGQNQSVDGKKNAPIITIPIVMMCIGDKTCCK